MIDHDEFKDFCNAANSIVLTGISLMEITDDWKLKETDALKRVAWLTTFVQVIHQLARESNMAVRVEDMAEWNEPNLDYIFIFTRAGVEAEAQIPFKLTLSRIKE